MTLQFFPKEGINIFGGLLHTHLLGKNSSQHKESNILRIFFLLGKSLTLRHFRRTDSCEGVQELPYIDYNNNYDTNYQVELSMFFLIQSIGTIITQNVFSDTSLVY